MDNVRIYNRPPFEVAVIHGGPGAPGSLAPVATELSKARGVLEPLQTASSVEGQLDELEAVLTKHASLPVTLIGHSWGAWLSFLFAARYPRLVKKLILVGSGPFEEKYAFGIMETRFSRMSPEVWTKVRHLLKALHDPTTNDRDEILAMFGKLMTVTDSYDPLPEAGRDDEIRLQADVFQQVWAEAEALRKSGELLRRGQQIWCPVVAIHGDYDPHPAAGVELPLRETVHDFRFILLEKCGHEPWKERQARDKFYLVLEEELREAGNGQAWKDQFSKLHDDLP